MAAYLETRAGRRAHARTTPEARDFLATARDGWRVVHTTSGDRGGMTAHRGVLHPNEYVDVPRLRELVAHRLGFTVDELHAVYRQGRMSAASLELRAHVDARLLELRERGGNMEALARATGVGRKVIDDALARARSHLYPAV